MPSVSRNIGATLRNSIPLLIAALMCAFANPAMAQERQDDASPYGFMEGLANVRDQAWASLSDPAKAADEGLTLYRDMAESLASSRDIDKAAAAYVAMVCEMAECSIIRQQQVVPDDILDDALPLARDKTSAAIIHFMTAWSMSESPDGVRKARAGAEFAAAGAIPPGTMRDEMLLRHAAWAQTSGYSSLLEDGTVVSGADYERAMALYEELAATTADARRRETAQAIVSEIRTPALKLTIGNTFRSGSQVQIHASWRNCERVDIALHALDLDRITPPEGTTDLSAWADSLQPRSDSQPVRRLTLASRPAHPYYSVEERVSFDDLLLPGAYLVQSSGNGLQDNEILVISDNVITLKVSADKVIAFVCNATTGAPVDDASIVLWVRGIGDNAVWTRYYRSTEEDGLAVFDNEDFGTSPDLRNRDILAMATDQRRPAIVILAHGAGVQEASRTAALVTDADAYTAGDQVRIAALVRENKQGAFQPVSGEPLQFTLSRSDSSFSRSLESTTDATGMAIASFLIDDSFASGSYFATAKDAAGRVLGRSASLSVFCAEDSDSSVSISLRHGPDSETCYVGETVRGLISVRSTQGEGLSGRALWLQVEECPYNAGTRTRTGPWREFSSQHIQTDSVGDAAFSIQTSASVDSDFLYRVRVRVQTDPGKFASAQSSFTAARHDVYPSLRTSRSVFEQGQSVVLHLETFAADASPIMREGTLRIMREAWKEVWIDRRGREISGEEMMELRRKRGGWFSFGQGAGDYLLKSQGYESETVAEIPLTTGPNGEARHELTNLQPGCHRIIWITEGGRGGYVSSECTFWVAGPSGEISGFRPGALSFHANPETRPPDGRNLVLITAPVPDQYVLFVGGTDGIETWGTRQVRGTAQILDADFSARARGAPVFVDATCISDERLNNAAITFGDDESRLLDVTLHSDKFSREPGERAEWTVRVCDAMGRPVQGARVLFWLTSGPGAGASLLDKVFSSSPYGAGAIASASSAQLRPFYSISAQRTAPTAPNPAMSFVGENAPTRNIGHGSQLWTETRTSADGLAVVSFDMPRAISDWVAHALVSQSDGGAGLASANTRTIELLAPSMEVPAHVYRSDILSVEARLTNNRDQPCEVVAHIFSSGLDSALAPFDPGTFVIEPSKTIELECGMAFHDQGTTRIVLESSGADRPIRLERQLRVLPDPYSVTQCANALLMDGSVTLPEAGRNTQQGEIRFCMTASPSRVALGAMRHLLEDRTAGSTEAAGRIATILSLRRMFERMRYDSESISKAMNRSGVDRYMEERLASDMDILARTQAQNGAWGWLTPNGADVTNTAYNLIMLNLCDGEIAASLAPRIEAARAFAASELVEGRQPDDVQAMLLMAIASRDLTQTRPSRLEARALTSLMRAQERLSPVALACLALCAKQYGFDEEAAKMIESLRASAILDTAVPGRESAHWESSGAIGGTPVSTVESTALACLAIVAVEGPDSELLQMALRHMVANCTDGHWDGPRETALCILALRDIASYSGETDIGARCELFLGNESIATYDHEVNYALTVPTWTRIPSLAVAGRRTLTLRRTSGNAPVFLLVSSDNNNLDRALVPASSAMEHLTVGRRYLRTRQVPTLLNGYDEEIVEIRDGDTLECGQQIEVEITIKAESDIPRLLLEEPQPAFAAYPSTDPSSRSRISCIDGDGRSPGKIVMENTPEGILASIENLPAGTWSIRYRMTVRFEGEFAVPAARVCLPQRPSQFAATSAHRLRCVKAE
jgi:hypothetical protein